MPGFSVCTIIARNYWAHARILARSLHRHHPGVSMHVLLVDPEPSFLRAAGREGFDIITPDRIGIDERELHRMAGIYNVLELSTALKPWLLRTLLAQGEGPVVYLDPDIELFGSIDEAAEGAASHGLALTPHILGPQPLTEYGPNELTVLQSGVYNLGFVAVGASAGPFLDWWAERLRRDCLISKPEGKFVDQRWIDLAPVFFTPHVIAGPGWNVAYWNLSSRELGRGPSGYEVDGEPLRFFHFSGFDPHNPGVLSHYLGPDPNLRPAGNPVLGELCASYAECVMWAGHRAFSALGYPYDRTPDGLDLDPLSRRLYRRELLKSEQRGLPEPPNPFEDSDGFTHWLNSPQRYDAVSRYLRLLYEESPDLKVSFPDLLGGDARRYLDWVRSGGAEAAGIPERLVPRWRKRKEGIGVNVAGYVAAESGVGGQARMLVRALDAAGIDSAVLAYANTSSRQEAPAPSHRYGDPIHGTNIVCVNADQLPYFVAEHEDLIKAARRTIGLWAWEVDRLPEWMAQSVDLVDEVWTCSHHAATAVRAWTDKPVHVFALPVVAPVAPPKSRGELGLPDGFVFLFSFDFDSVVERKNPLGLIEAFCRAFPEPGTASLVIKSVRGDAHPEELERLRDAAAKRPDVVVMDGYLSQETQHALLASCDVFVSLHRAEGFGLHLAEAMSLGKPVVATGYSGNLEFMDDTNSYLVGYELVNVPPGCDPYPTDARWASPDLDAAAGMMRQVVAGPAEAAERGRRAAQDMARLHSPRARTSFLRDRLSYTITGEPFEAWTPAETSVHYLTTGPEVSSPTRYGPLSRLVRKIVMRVMRHYAEHTDRVDRALLDALREAQEQVALESAATVELEQRVRDLEAELGSPRRSDADLDPPGE